MKGVDLPPGYNKRLAPFSLEFPPGTKLGSWTITGKKAVVLEDGEVYIRAVHENGKAEWKTIRALRQMRGLHEL